MADLSDINVSSIQCVCNLLFDKYDNYLIEADENGDSLLSCIVVSICYKKYMISNRTIQIINFLIEEGFDKEYINPITKKSIKNIIMETNSTKYFISKNCMSDMFDTRELFISNISNKTFNLNLDIAELYKNDKFTINGYTGTGLHYILNICKNVPQSIFEGVNNINELDSLDRTFLDILLQHRHTTNVQFLIMNGANLNRISTFYGYNNKLNISPLTFACGYLSQATALHLINAPNVDLNLKNQDGTTALISVAKLGKIGITLTLYEAGADSKILDNNGKNALNYVHNSGLKLKLSKNVKVNDYYNKNLQSAPPDEGVNTCCKICMDNQIDILFYPCKHALCCNTCYKQLSSKQLACCTLCKSKIDFVLDFKL